MYYEDITETFPGLELDAEEGYLYNDELNLFICKNNGVFYAIMEETEKDEMRVCGGRVYLLDFRWYLPFDIEAFSKDYEAGKLSWDNFDATEYELNLDE